MTGRECEDFGGDWEGGRAENLLFPHLAVFSL